MDNEIRAEIIKNLEAITEDNDHEILTVVPIESANNKRSRHLVLIRSSSEEEQKKNVKPER